MATAHAEAKHQAVMTSLGLPSDTLGTEDWREELAQCVRACRAIWALDGDHKFTDHGELHSLRIVEHFITLGPTLSVTPYERLMFVIAAYVHDIGMRYNSWAGLPLRGSTGTVASAIGMAEPVQKLDWVREHHVTAGSKLVEASLRGIGLWELPEPFCTPKLLGRDLLVAAHTVAFAHSAGRLLEELKVRDSFTFSQRRDPQGVVCEPRKIAGLLRFCDELDGSYVRVPHIDYLLDSTMNPTSRAHWLACYFTDSVVVKIDNDIRPAKVTVKIAARFPKDATEDDRNLITRFIRAKRTQQIRSTYRDVNEVCAVGGFPQYELRLEVSDEIAQVPVAFQMSAAHRAAMLLLLPNRRSSAARGHEARDEGDRRDGLPADTAARSSMREGDAMGGKAARLAEGVPVESVNKDGVPSDQSGPFPTEVIEIPFGQQHQIRIAPHASPPADAVRNEVWPESAHVSSRANAVRKMNTSRVEQGMEEALFVWLEAHSEAGHFELVRGQHTDQLVHMRALVSDGPLVRSIADHIRALYAVKGIDQIVGVGTSCMLLSTRVAIGLDAAFAHTIHERPKKGESFDHPIDMQLVLSASAQRILVIDDIVAQGRTAGKLIKRIRKALIGRCPEIMYVGLFHFTRGSVRMPRGIQFRALCEVPGIFMSPSKRGCPDCMAGRPFVLESDLWGLD